MTSEPKWTPGPWDFSMAKMPIDGEYDYCISAVVDGERYVISEAFGRVSEKQRPNAHANARLIAAAPELYEALERLLKWVAPIAGDNHDKDREREEMASVEAACSALRKARGES